MINKLCVWRLCWKSLKYSFACVHNVDLRQGVGADPQLFPALQADGPNQKTHSVKSLLYTIFNREHVYYPNKRLVNENKCFFGMAIGPQKPPEYSSQPGIIGVCVCVCVCYMPNMEEAARHSPSPSPQPPQPHLHIYPGSPSQISPD